MITFKKTHTVPYSANAMYDLVNDIESYSKFLPWCQSATIHAKSQTDLEATLVIHASGFTQTLTTKNTMVPGEKIHIRLVKGPLSHLEASWVFEPCDATSCLIHFEIQFEFSNSLVRMALEPMFNKISQTIMEAFLSRAKEIYSPI